MARKRYSLLSLFSGAGGLDLGFELENFDHLECVEIDDHSVTTLRRNRPKWNVRQIDVRHYKPKHPSLDVLIGGPPCQGFSLGGNRDASDERNTLFLEMIKVAKKLKPRVIVIENVLNLRTMTAPWSGKNFEEEISGQLNSIGYEVRYGIFKMCHFGVPQTRRRFVFIAVRGKFPDGYSLPEPSDEVLTIREALFDLGQDDSIALPNHQPLWNFQSGVHTNLMKSINPSKAIAVPFRISRTGSDGHPIRSFDDPFPAVDTATVWGWARGRVKAERLPKDRSSEKYIRNPDANLTLWRVTADQMRTFTHREYARLQTFPDDWVFVGRNKRDIHKQIGNAVPVQFAKQVALNVRQILAALDAGKKFPMRRHAQMALDI